MQRGKKCGIIQKGHPETNVSGWFSGIEVTGLELYTMLFVIENIAVYCHIFLLYHILFLLFHTFKKKSVYF